MAGIFGIVSEEDCIRDLYNGTKYLQHRAQNYCGLAFFNGKDLQDFTHRGYLKENFPEERRKEFKGCYGIGSVSVTREPVVEISKSGGMITTFDGNLINNLKLKENLLKKGISFSGYKNPEQINDTVLISKIIASELNFEKGIEKLIEVIEGDFSLVSLTGEGVYAVRGWGRKPLILGKKNGSYAVSSESNSFVNTGFEIVRDVEPGEIVFLNKNGIHNIQKLDLSPIRCGTFEWIYSSYPPSVVDEKSVVDVRMMIGKALAKRYPIKADFVSPIPNSGRWHAIGYSHESKISYIEAFARYDYSDRSYTQEDQEKQQKTADEKLIPIPSIIKGKKLIIVDDSIVRGTQTKNQISRLRDFGAKEIHGRIACPPLMASCKYGKSTKKNEDCIARVMSVEEIKKTRGFDTLGYATIEDLEKAIGLSKNKICLECWEG